MFQRTACPSTASPDPNADPIGPFCYECLSSTSPVTQCFVTNAELRMAVDAYIEGNTAAKTAVKTKYGDLIGSWCVDDVTDFSRVVSSKTSFNKPLLGWNTVSAESIAIMFYNASGAFE